MNFLARSLFRLKLAAKSFTMDVSRLDPEIWYRDNGFKRFWALLGGGGPSEAGVSVSPDSALRNSVVWACVRVISETLACLPLNLMQDVKGEKRVAKEHPLYRLCHDEPNSDMSDMEWREASEGHLLIRGNAYTKITRRSGSDVILALDPINPDLVEAKRREDKTLYYTVTDSKGARQDYAAADILHVRGLGFDGITGYSVFDYARNSIGLSEVQQKYVSNWFARGGRRPYLLEHPARFKNDEDFKEWVKRWEGQYGTADTFHKTPVLEGGLKYTELGFSPRDAQFLEGREFSVADICRWFRISPTFVQDLTHATFSNIEHLAIQFVQHTMMPWCVRWEKALNRSLLTDKEKAQGYYFKHTLNALLRGDFASRMQGFASALQNAIMSPNEVRALEDMNPYEGGDDYHIQLNMQTNNADGTPTASQAASLVKLGTSKTGGANEAR